MSLIEYKPDLSGVIKNADDKKILHDIEALRSEAVTLFEAAEYQKAYEKTVESLHRLREFSDFSNLEFRVAFVTLLFDLAEIHYALKDFKMSKKQLEHIFKYIDPLLKHDADRFGSYHLMAMELSTKVLRSRKRMLELLAKQQEHTGMLYEKVNAGVAAATDRLVDSLCKDAELMASTGDYRGAIRFYMEAIKLSKKRTGRVTEREVAMTVAVARLMMHSRQQTDRAKRLLEAVLPHAKAVGSKVAPEEINDLIRNIDEKKETDSLWRSFLNKVQSASKYIKWDKKSKEPKSEESEEKQ